MYRSNTPAGCCFFQMGKESKRFLLLQGYQYHLGATSKKLSGAASGTRRSYARASQLLSRIPVSWLVLMGEIGSWYPQQPSARYTSHLKAISFTDLFCRTLPASDENSCCIQPSLASPWVPTLYSLENTAVKMISHGVWYST